MKRLSKSFIVLFLLGAVLSACGQVPNNDLTKEIQKQVKAQKAAFSYPKSVLRYYKQHNFQSAWIKPQNGTGPTWQAMLTLDCVMAFGLSHDDYHPKLLTYALLHHILDTPGKVDVKTQAKFEVMLTDAIITLMNHLHYGKLNPDYPAAKIDQGTTVQFKADEYLSTLIGQKDLITAIADVQPKNKWYASLQYRMQLLKGKYQDDCYEVPETEVRKIAINMERLRWAGVEGNNYIMINVPTFTLTYQQPDTAYQFKVVVGKPDTPTPALSTTISYFRYDTALLLPLTNSKSIDLQDTTEKGIAKRYIRVEQAAKLGELLLKNDGQKAGTIHQNQTFKLKSPVPLHITYITCAVGDYGLVIYKDIYNQDKALETALYNINGPLGLK